MPGDILITVLNEFEMEKIHRKHSRFWSRNIQGFALNRKNMLDFSSIFIKQNPLDMLMLTIGHEIGHCLSITQDDTLLEEAKAFAFELAWMKTIHKNDIQGLKNCLSFPSLEGLHNEAFQFVISRQEEPLAVFWKIVKGELNINNK
jgi:hypothetical protein